MAANLGSVLISGANRGIGLEMVRQMCLNDKNRIFAGCRNPDAALELKDLAERHKNLSVLKLDIAKDGDIEAAVGAVSSKAGWLNVLINNAGIFEGGRSTLKDQTREMLQKHFDVNCTSGILMAKAFRDLLAKGVANHPAKKNSIIVNVSTEMGSITNASTNCYPYRTSKTAVNMASKCMGNELVSEGIYCIAIHPGWVQTEMGGPNATVTVSDSASGILKVASEVTEEQNGKFVDYLGKYRQY